MFLKNDNQTATVQKKTTPNQIFNFLVAAGKLKQVINSDLFTNTKMDQVQTDLVKITSSLDDALRERAGAVWSLKDTFPEINIVDTSKVAFNVKFETTASQITSSSNVLGQYKENITLLSNKNAFKFSLGNFTTLSTYNPQTWKVFISNNSSSSIKPTIKEGKTYFDHVFEMNVPFTKKEIETFHSPIGSMYVDIKPIYNFFVDNYETAINNNNTKEQLLPNMYAFCTELRNENTDEKNTIFKQHITLAGTIPDVFVDVTNNKGEKIGEKDKGEYFDKYAFAFSELLRVNAPAENFLRRKFTNLVAPITNMDLFKDFNEKRELFPMYFDLSFSTDNSTQFAQILEDSQLSSVLVKDIIDGNILPETGSFQETTVETEEKNTKLTKVANTNKNILRVWDISKWVEKIANNPVGSFDALQTGVFLGTLNDEIKLATTPQYDLYKNLLVIIFLGKLKTLVDNNIRTYEEMLKGKLAYSENVLYRIEKVDASTSQVIQNFYLPNSNKIDALRFIDTQVKYNKKYTYNIFTYQMVLGNKYQYSLKKVTDDTANVDVVNEPSLKLVEVLYHQFSGRIMDEPPVPPDVDIIPYRGVNNQVLFNINTETGRYFLEPILIEPTDVEIIKQLREAQMVGEKEFLEYATDDRAAAFEIFRLERKPHKYQDFSGKRIALIPTDISSISLQAATAASFIDNILPNKKYYYIFRAIDNHGHISNPTSVFELELVDADGSIYPIIQVVDFEKNADLRSTTKPVRKYIQLVPAFNQRIINEEKSGLVVAGQRVDSVLDKEKIHLGIADEQVWDKTFRIRLTSRKTGKKIDFDIQFQYEHIRKE